MAFDDFRNRPRYALGCHRWATGAPVRQAQIRADPKERQRRVLAYAREHRCSEAEAERQLFEDDGEAG